MIRRLAWLVLFLVCVAPAAAQPPEVAPPKDATTPVKADDKGGSTLTLPDGTTVKLVNREKMRVKPGTRSMTVPRHLKGVIATLPIPPPTYDWTAGGTVNFPILGNDSVGDCYYVYMAHAVQLWMAAHGTPVTFDQSKLISRYRKLSGGDNGLGDYDVFGQNHNGEFYGGIVGPGGPHKILDHMTVNPSDPQAIALAQWAFGGTAYTCSLCNSWLNNVKPGAVWDKGTPNPSAGHAVLLSGKKVNGRYTVETWAIQPPIELTQAGLESADPEVLVCFSLEWFDPQTGKAPNGLSYQELADLWHTLGGRQLPPSPFTPPVPPTPVPPVPVPPVPVPPVPVPGSGFTGSLNYVNGTLVSVTVGNAPAPVGTVDDGLKKAGVSPALVLKLLTDLQAKPIDRKLIREDLLEILLSIAFGEPKAVGSVEPAPPPRERFARREEPDYNLTP